MSALAVAIDIGGTKIAAALVNSQGELSARSHTATPRSGADDVAHAVVSLARQTIAAAPGPVTVCGIGSAGVIGHDGSVISATDLIPGWAGTPLAAHVRAELGLATYAVNDVHATGIGEALAGAAVGADPVLLMAIGTGIGGALIVDGEVLIGAHGISGALGHTPISGVSESRTCSCGTPDHLEPHASGPGLELSAASLPTITQPASLREVAALARTGDASAQEIFTTGGQLIGQALGVHATIVDPALIVIGGGVSALTDLLLPGIRQGMNSSGFGPARTIDVIPAQLGSDAPLVGAGLHAIGQLKTDTLST